MNKKKKERERERRKKEKRPNIARTLDVTAGLSFDWHPFFRTSALSRREREREREREKLLCRNDFSLYSGACDVEKSLDVDAFVHVSRHRVKTKQAQRNIGFVRAGKLEISLDSGYFINRLGESGPVERGGFPF